MPGLLVTTHNFTAANGRIRYDVRPLRENTMTLDPQDHLLVNGHRLFLYDRALKASSLHFDSIIKVCEIGNRIRFFIGTNTLWNYYIDLREKFWINQEAFTEDNNQRADAADYQRDKGPTNSAWYYFIKKIEI